ncbi:MAG: hypothetical protein KDC12_02935 [Flavobacteriales bacterium]|nr:hypothetical protein [Flavobacteriales bacterium]
MTSDQHIEIAQLQKEIGTYIGMGENSLLFNFEEHSNHFTLHLITVNPRHNQSFLYHTTEGLTKAGALKTMLSYVQEHKEKENSYTIQWSLQGENVLHTSYFSAKNILGALDKLYYDRDPNIIVVFNVALNPMS